MIGVRVETDILSEAILAVTRSLLLSRVVYVLKYRLSMYMSSIVSSDGRL